MENCSWDVTAARDRSVISSFLQPLDKPVPMVATADVGRVAAELLRESWAGRQVIELEGPRRVSPNEIAATFAEVIGHPVLAEAVPRQTWEQLFKSQGMKHPEPRMQMLDGFNEGWIEFEHRRIKAAERPNRIERGFEEIGAWQVSEIGMARRPELSRARFQHQAVSLSRRDGAPRNKQPE